MLYPKSSKIFRELLDQDKIYIDMASECEYNT